VTQALVLLADSRTMPEVSDESMALVVTSPPYYAIKDYGPRAQIGRGQSLHEYLTDLYRVWAECHRTLVPGGRLCINIGDQFARAAEFGRYKVIPLHSEITAQGEQIGFDYMGAIIWRKKTTLETSGGAVVMGSFPYPPNGIVELDYEFILIFKKPGSRAIPREEREKAKLSREEWKTCFSGHWAFGGARQVEHQAMFPVELPRRLVRMFTVPGDTVLDPFLGSGTTAQAALALGRSAVGYEINPDFLPIIEESLQPGGEALGLYRLEVKRPERDGRLGSISYKPSIPELKPISEKPARRTEELHRVKEIEGPERLRLGDRQLRLLGISVPPERKDAALAYLGRYVRGKEVYLRTPVAGSPDAAYVYLKNRLFINRKMLEMGLAVPSDETEHPCRQRFHRALESYLRTRNQTELERREQMP